LYFVPVLDGNSKSRTSFRFRRHFRFIKSNPGFTLIPYPALVPQSGITVLCNTQNHVQPTNRHHLCNFLFAHFLKVIFPKVVFQIFLFNFQPRQQFTFTCRQFWQTANNSNLNWRSRNFFFIQV